MAALLSPMSMMPKEATARKSPRFTETGICSNELLPQ
jgi:hypothetical protein